MIGPGYKIDGKEPGTSAFVPPWKGGAFGLDSCDQQRPVVPEGSGQVHTFQGALPWSHIALRAWNSR
jgi:hypothetical protein